MAAQPTHEAICQFVELTGLDYQEAQSRLKGNNNNLVHAMNEYFDNPGSTQYRYDESQFGADRDGMVDHNVPSFQIQGADEYGEHISGAPSRPPSRTDNQSPLGRVVSLAAEHAAADPYSRMNAAEVEDQEMQKAIAASRITAGIGPQEYGVVDSEDNVKYFGPANQTRDYNSGQWGMVHVPQAAAEVEDIPDPIDRKREVGFPAFLRPSSYNTRLPAMITIFHEIGLMRELFLERDDVLPDYGFDKSWWEGAPIDAPDPPPRYNVDTETMENPPLNHKLIYELQRLMAFLDKTDRSYGSADNLYNIVNKGRNEDAEVRFFEKWKSLHVNADITKSVFSKAIQTSAETESTEAETEEMEFSMLNVEMDSVPDAAFMETLYDVTDHLLWKGSGDTIDATAYISHVADIFCFKVFTLPNGKAIQAPLVWYPDRYLETAKEAALEMRLRKAQVIERLTRVLHLEGRLTDYKMPDGTTVKVQYLLERAAKHASETTVQSLPNGVSQDTDAMELTPETQTDLNKDLTSELRKVIDNVDKKMKELNREKEQALASLRELSSLCTEPSPQQPLHPYTLRGVSATKNVTFVCRKAEPDLIDMDLDATEPKSDGDQWWKITFNISSSQQKPIEIYKASPDDVLHAIVHESKDPILIYASERAVNFKDPISDLPPSLDSFVRADNLSFSEEFPDNTSQFDSQMEISSPKSPGKRKLSDTDEDEEFPARYAGGDKSVKWSQMTPPSEGEEDEHNQATTSHHEVVPTNDKTQPNNEVVMGVDPDNLIDLSTPAPEQEQKSLSTEMQSRTGMPSLLTKTEGRVESVVNTNENQSPAANAARQAWAKNN